MLEKIKNIILGYVDVDPNTITPECNIRTDLALNSLELVNLAVEIEDEFDVTIPDKEAVTLETVGDVMRIIEKYSK